ncbi:MAG: DUF1579 family protein [Planctomycetes bacterium]|nr:DUF1579 family protein [Planctomycetota bacterium]
MICLAYFRGFRCRMIGAGEMNIRMTGGGLWQVMDFRGDMAGRPFTGHGVAGFDMMQQKYVHCWVDSMSTSILNMTGTLDERAKTMTFVGEMQSAMGVSKLKETTREITPDELLFTIELPTPDGGFFTIMKAVYRRRKS